MSFHFCAHSWEVRDIEGGTLVKLTHRDLDMETIPVLVDELLELVLESGQPNLHLDLSEIRQVRSVVLGKMLALDTKLREHGGRLVLLHLDPFTYDLFRVGQLTDILDIRQAEAAETVA